MKGGPLATNQAGWGSLTAAWGEAQPWHCSGAFGNLGCNNSLHPCPGRVSTSGENPASAAGFSAKLELKHVVLNGNWISCSVDV